MKTIKETAYNRYQLNWMLNHNCSVMDLIQGVQNYLDSCKERPSVVDAYREWEINSGFEGSCYACYDEFLDNEYKDIDYMRSILSPTEYEKYLSEKIRENASLLGGE